MAAAIEETSPRFEVGDVVYFFLNRVWESVKGDDAIRRGVIDSQAMSYEDGEERFHIRYTDNDPPREHQAFCTRGADRIFKSKSEAKKYRQQWVDYEAKTLAFINSTPPLEEATTPEEFFAHLAMEEFHPSRLRYYLASGLTLKELLIVSLVHNHKLTLAATSVALTEYGWSPVSRERIRSILGKAERKIMERKRKCREAAWAHCSLED